MDRLNELLTHIARCVPSETHLQIMVVRDETQDLCQKLLALSFGHSIYTAAVQPASKEGLPPGYGVRTHHGLAAVSISNRNYKPEYRHHTLDFV